PITGLPVGASGDGSGAAVSAAVSSNVPSRPAEGGRFFGALAAVELLAIVLVPGLFALQARRRRLAP
ncbi:hypothetical protein, partial [Cellulomonas sp. ICMP 17802]|uniref:hypothetical protein n=1 Tax=Cellulomonas sp. ICMP 17802 TaxID=3239199 RepID=UPI00351AE65F